MDMEVIMRITKTGWDSKYCLTWIGLGVEMGSLKEEWNACAFHYKPCYFLKSQIYGTSLVLKLKILIIALMLNRME